MNTAERFEQLITLHRNALIACIRFRVPDRYDAEEIEADVICRALAKYVGEQLQVEDFERWIKRCAANACNDYWRRAAVRQRDISFDGQTFESALEEHKGGLAFLAGDVLEQLDPRDRDCVYLCHIEGLKKQEAAEVLGLTLSELKYRLYRGNRDLKPILRPYLSPFQTAHLSPTSAD